ncbi:hypothetical protein [Ralstonia solanacearum]|uniref:hypothetical protein n=1 Tax=Ralstonia solanacearum TaxID=305 RepID=UPI0018CFF3AE|nr:hypothetical protein [Ralstonia solanacearum]
MRVSYEAGDHVKADSATIQAWLGERAPPDLSTRDRRVRGVFGDDKERAYTNPMLYLMDFLRDMEDSVVVDLARKNLLV